MKHRRFVSRLLVLASSLYCTSAWAQAKHQDAETQVVELLIEGDALFDAADYAMALQRFQQADERMPVPTAGVRVAEAQARLGKLINARNKAIAVSQLPPVANEPPAMVKARTRAEALAKELSARIPSLIVRIQGEGTGASVSGVVLTLDGEPLDVGVAREVDPGAHRLQAKAPGYSDLVEDRVISEPAATESGAPPAGPPSEGALPLQGPAVEGTPGPATPTGDGSARNVVEILLTLKPVASPAPRPPLPRAESLPPPQPEPSLWSKIPVLGYIGFGIGAVGLSVGSATGLVSWARTKSIRDEDCAGGSACDPKSRDERESANTLANVSNVAFGVGVVGVGLGLYAVLTHPEETASASPRVAELSLDLGQTPMVVRPEVNAQGLFVTGEF